MNKERREEIEEIVGILRGVEERLNTLAEQEREAFENLPDGLQVSERGGKMEEAADALDDVAARVSEMIDELEEL